MASTIHGIQSYLANSNSYFHFWEHGTLFTTVDTSTIRNIWTSVFVVLNVLIVLSGDVFLKSLNVHRLKKRKRVPVNRLTPWMSVTAAGKYWYATYRLPGGFYGLLMLVTGLFGLVDQYFVNSFIIPSGDIQWECIFQNGVLTTAVPNRNLTIVPVSTFSAVTTVYNAQYQVYWNGGRWGIYEKVNSNYTSFSPTMRDVIGGWNCFYEQDATIAWAEWQNDSDVQNFLDTQGFLFSEAIANLYVHDVQHNGVIGFLEWSADQPDNSSLQWNVRASVANNLGGSSAPVDSTRTVTNLECRLVAANNRILPSMPSNRSLTEWVQKTYGFLMNVEPESFGFYIEWMLNAMVMVTGSGNYDQWTASDLSAAGASNTYGCTLQGTNIRPEIWIFLGALLLVVVPLFVADTFLYQIYGWNVDHAHLVKGAPSNCVEEWQLALVIEKTGDDSIKATDIWDYSYGWDADEQKFVVSKNSKNTTLKIEARVVD